MIKSQLSLVIEFKDVRIIEATLDGIPPIQYKKYKITINGLLAENEKLEKRARESGKMKDRMEWGKSKKKFRANI